jgi:hypothetical protein
MRWIGFLSLALVFATGTARAVDKKTAAGTVARAAIPARNARLAEPAKDATPPKYGGIKRPGDYRKVSTVAPRIVFERVR